MEVILKKWGNSVALRLPSSLLKQASLAENQRVDISAKRGVVVVKPAQRRTYTLSELIAGITRKNRHDSIDFGAPVGRELL
jgi:antitoxin MazE